MKPLFVFTQNENNIFWSEKQSTDNRNVPHVQLTFKKK